LLRKLQAWYNELSKEMSGKFRGVVIRNFGDIVERPVGLSVETVDTPVA
jgi:hypothetical protein